MVVMPCFIESTLEWPVLMQTNETSVADYCNLTCRQVRNSEKKSDDTSKIELSFIASLQITAGLLQRGMMHMTHINSSSSFSSSSSTLRTCKRCLSE